MKLIAQHSGCSGTRLGGVILMKQDNVVDPQAATFADPGIAPTSIEEILPAYLERQRSRAAGFGVRTYVGIIWSAGRSEGYQTEFDEFALGLRQYPLEALDGGHGHRGQPGAVGPPERRPAHAVR